MPRRVRKGEICFGGLVRSGQVRFVVQRVSSFNK